MEGTIFAGARAVDAAVTGLGVVPLAFLAWNGVVLMFSDGTLIFRVGFRVLCSHWMRFEGGIVTVDWA